MDSLINAAARALARGDLLGALKRVALREDAPALALRGIVMAQLGELGRAKDLLKRAESAFGPNEAVARARCVVAQAEIALASRDLGWPTKSLAAARATLKAHGDVLNTAHASHLEIRRFILIGRLDDAERAIADLDPRHFPPALRATHELVIAGIAIRRLKIGAARVALARAQHAARHTHINALIAEVDRAVQSLEIPAARLISGGSDQLLLLSEVEALLAADVLVIDACRYVVRQRDVIISLTRRPVLFGLARTIAEAWPSDVPRDILVRKVFRAKEADESHRARLRVEIGRLRKEVAGLADIRATAGGFTLVPQRTETVVVLAPPVDDEYAAVLALLADGEAWSSSALALALEASQRTVQRALDALKIAGKAEPYGSGRASRWVAPLSVGFTTTLLLPGPLSGG